MRHPDLAVSEIVKADFEFPSKPVRVVELVPPDDLPIADLVEMYVNIESALGDHHRRSIQFACMAPGYGSEEVALNLAWAGSAILGKRIILLSGSAPLAAMGRSSVTLDETAAIQLPGGNQDLVKVMGRETYLGDLQAWRGKNGTIISDNDIDRHLEELSLHFDMIMIAPPPLDLDPLGTVLARHVDGNVIVIEAEHTRRFAAIRLREILARSGRPTVGAVLAGRRSYLPRWLTRIL